MGNQPPTIRLSACVRAESEPVEPLDGGSNDMAHGSMGAAESYYEPRIGLELATACTSDFDSVCWLTK